MDFFIEKYDTIQNNDKDIGMPLYAGNGITVECYKLRKSTTVMISHDEPEYFTGETRTVCIIVVSGSIMIWMGEEKVSIHQGNAITLFPDRSFSVWAGEDSFLLFFHNKVEPDVDNSPAELVNAVHEVELADTYLLGHNYRVGKYSTLMMQIISPGRFSVPFHMAATFHDVGKAVVPPEILNKEGKLTSDEFALIKNHPAASYEMLKEFIGEKAACFARWHHEKLDGSGYPDGLIGEEIPLESRIMAVADIFDALTTARCYRKAFSFTQAIDIMKSDVQSGKLDDKVFSVLVSLIENGKIVDGEDNLVTIPAKKE